MDIIKILPIAHVLLALLNALLAIVIAIVQAVPAINAYIWVVV
jgi:hypothetical protein